MVIFYLQQAKQRLTSAAGDKIIMRLYKRKYLRIKPDFPLYGSLRIVGVGSKKVHTGTAKVRIIDISPGGLRFVSSLRFIADRRIMIEITFSIEEKEYCLTGWIVQGYNTEVNQYEYGVCFNQKDENLRESIKRLYRKIMVKMEKHIVLIRIN